MYNDCVGRTVLRSDAYACYEVCPCCLPKAVGIQWAICNILLQLTGIWVAMAQLSDECDNHSWWECISGDAHWELEDKVSHTLEDWLHW